MNRIAVSLSFASTSRSPSLRSRPFPLHNRTKKIRFAPGLECGPSGGFALRSPNE